MKCLSGTNSSGPTDGTSCDQWTFTVDTCHVAPVCHDYLSCDGCTEHEECVWCASSDSCTSLPEALGSDCRGLVFDPPCPDTYVAGWFSSIEC